MTIKTLNAIERSCTDLMLPPVTVPDSVATDVLNDTITAYDDYAYIEIFNAGANKAYFAYGRDCNISTSFNGYLVAGQAMTIITRQRVSVYSAGGTIIARTVLKRNDNFATI